MAGPYFVETGVDRGGGGGAGGAWLRLSNPPNKNLGFPVCQAPNGIGVIKQTMTIHAECVEEWANAYMTVQNMRGKRTFSWGWTYRYLSSAAVLFTSVLGCVATRLFSANLKVLIAA